MISVQDDFASRERDVLGALGKAVPIAAALLPVSGAFVRWIAFVTAGFRVPDPVSFCNRGAVAHPHSYRSN